MCSLGEPKIINYKGPYKKKAGEPGSEKVGHSGAEVGVVQWLKWGHEQRNVYRL